MPLTILHVITGLADGGAEANLYRLCVNDTGNRHVVVSLMDKGKYGPLLTQHGIEVHALKMSPGSVSLLKIRNLIRLLRAVNPDVVHTWMYHGCLVGSIAARCVGATPVVWGIHHSKLDREGLKLTTFLIMKALAAISRSKKCPIVYCAKSAALAHRQHGYWSGREQIIPNGYDLLMFAPSFPNSREGAQPTPRLGMVARWHPIKDHRNLFQALHQVAQHGEDFHLVLVGSGMDGNNPEIRAMLAEYRLEGRTEMLGSIDSVPDFMRSLDLHILSSKGEAFPNVLAEAMACGTPCVSTDVGDATEIVGDTGWVVPPQDPTALARAVNVALSERNTQAWRLRRDAARKRIQTYFSIGRMVEEYNSVWNQECANNSGCRSR
jgi:glycosyltransferase involved in cell wall biosynthesis